ncbi:MAG TPA: alkaline phosphatase [Myxococcales bacterium]|nr:alkaline phosphatase [Myxococcales bacterium]HIK85581.1 alkaline phosphatase [Myxococcales bacterium]
MSALLRSSTLAFLLIFAADCSPPVQAAGGHLTKTSQDSGSTRVLDHTPGKGREVNAWFAAGRQSVRNAQPSIDGEKPAKNIILFVGDGMGISTVTAARILEGQRRGEAGEENILSFEELPYVAFSKTYNTDAQVSDSASTMTAMVSGVKTQTGVLGVDEQVRRFDHESVAQAQVLTILEEAEDRGLATGIISTASLTHATPAGCYAHVPIRSWQNDSNMSEEARQAGFPDIARQLVEFPHGDGLEVAMGGGRDHFRPRHAKDPEDSDRKGQRGDRRDLTHEWVSQGAKSRFIWNREQFLAIDPAKTSHLLGLFEPSHMQFESDRSHDRAGEPSLAEMTSLAIDLVSKDPDGFFLMVEAGRIDHGHHGGNAYRALGDTIALSDAVRIAMNKVDREDTLIVVTADHSHTLTIGGYPKRGNPILGEVVGFKWSEKKVGEGELALDADGRPYTTLTYSNGPGFVDDKSRGSQSDADTQSPDYRQAATIPLSSETHAGEDVPIYAGGPRAALFHGVQEQNYIYHAMVEAFGWTRAGIPIE